MEVPMPRVWVYNEKRFGELGETRWAVTWYEITTKGQARVDADPDYELDFDRDLDCCYRNYPTKAAALRFAPKYAAKSFFGTATVTKEVLEWMSEGDNVGCFEECSEREEVAA
jgi:hypothetical protein